jgi:arylsulfatase
VVYEANTFGRYHQRIESADALAPGKAEIVFEYKPDSAPEQTPGVLFRGATSTGTGTLTVNGKAEGSTHFANFGGFLTSIAETLDVGKDTGSAVSTQYTAPFPFTGSIDTVRIHLE